MELLISTTADFCRPAGMRLLWVDTEGFVGPKRNHSVSGTLTMLKPSTAKSFARFACQYSPDVVLRHAVSSTITRLMSDRLAAIVE